jgi:hypothetical protein
MQEVLIDRREFVTEDRVQVLDDRRVAAHLLSPFLIRKPCWSRPEGKKAGARLNSERE